jgi:hypothetical protein
MPVRKIPENYLGVTGAFPSAKNDRALGFESPLERDFMIQLEFDPEVASFEEQPVRIPVVRKGKRPVGYVPDVLVHYHPGRNGRRRKPVLTEVKKRTDLEKNKAKYAAKFAAARKFAAERGWEFRIVSEEEIYSFRDPKSAVRIEPDIVFNIVFAEGCTEIIGWQHSMRRAGENRHVGDVNVAANKVVETTQPIEVKVISEASREDWAHVVVRAPVSAQTTSLRPGSIAQIRKDSETSRIVVVPVTTAAGEPIYLTKSHRCYDSWVAEWKEHQRIVGKHLPWGNHRGNDALFGGVKLSDIGNPNYDYIQ